MGLVAMFFITFISTNASADAPTEHSGCIISIYDQGVEKVIVTKAPTIADALKEAGVELGAGDTVEPAPDTKLVANNYKVNIYRARPVVILDGETQMRVMTSHQSSRQIAQAADMELYPEDETQIDRVDDLLDYGGAGLKMTIDRATPFTLVLYGEVINARTQAETIEEMLKEKEITLGEQDTISRPPTDQLGKDMRVEIWRNGKQTTTEEQEVPFEVEQIQDADREIGFREVQTPGVPGKRMVTYEVVMKNGQEVSRTEIQSVITSEPKKQVELVGAKTNFDGDFAAALAELRSCEGGYDSWNPAGPYYGAYQFDQGTWAGAAPEGAEYGNATPAQQDQAARNLYMRRGWQPWPHCGAHLPDTFR